jgi:hypothetical protein
MATIKKPQKNRKGIPPKVEDASNNLTNLPPKKIGFKKDLNFKVDPDFKKEFKNFATDNDLSMHDLLLKVFDFYKIHNQ